MSDLFTDDDLANAEDRMQQAPMSDPTRDLPTRIVVGKNGAYWRDFTDDPNVPGYSMCPVSTDNDPVEPVAVYVRVEDPPAPTEDEPSTANGRDLLAHAVQYAPADADRKITSAKIIAVEAEARLAALSTTPTPELVDLVDRCRQHIAGLGADLSTIKAREATSAQRDAAAERAYEHLREIDNILTTALDRSTP